MDRIYITITGMQHYHGSDLLEKGMRVRLVKDPENKYDKEAIRAELEGLGKIGYVANSCCTVLGYCFSAGRLYDRIGDTATAKVKHVLPAGAICTVRKKDILYWPPKPSAGADKLPKEANAKPALPSPEAKEWEDGEA